jgi:purine-nucleoside phosphorylase
LAKSVSEKEGIDIKEGVYMWFTGPTFETPAEIRMAGILGADAVGMSTVPEAIVAHHAGMKVLGISCITNMAAGLQQEKLSHQEVFDTAQRVKPLFERLIRGIVKEI